MLASMILPLLAIQVTVGELDLEYMVGLQFEMAPGDPWIGNFYLQKRWTSSILVSWNIHYSTLGIYSPIMDSSSNLPLIMIYSHYDMIIYVYIHT